jgi:hypothetical protein
MNVVNTIAQGDVITKVTVTRKGALKKFDAVKVFSDYSTIKKLTLRNKQPCRRSKKIRASLRSCNC